MTYFGWILKLFGQMEFPIKFDTGKSGFSMVYIKRSQVIISNKYFLSLTADLNEQTVRTLMKYNQTCLKRSLKEKTKNWFSRPIVALCRSNVLQNAQREHSAIL